MKNPARIRRTLRSADRNACTVYALSATTGMTFEAAHAFAGWYFNRQNDCPVPVKDKLTKPVERVGNHTFVRISIAPGTTLRAFALSRYNSPGKFFVITKNHALAVVDGTVIDNLPKTTLGASLIGAWKAE